MRITLHNGRANQRGQAYSTKHNDRNFDEATASHIDPEQSRNNWYWRWNQANVPEQTFEDCEKQFYQENFSDYLEAQNQRHRKSRHLERVKTMDEYRQSRLGRPEEVILEVGHNGDTVPPEDLLDIFSEMYSWQRTTFPNIQILDIALHADEPNSAPHIHIRQVYLAHDAEGRLMQQQEGALREMGVKLPLPQSAEPRQRYNNRKITFTRACREHLQEICREYGLDIETDPREKSQTGRTLLQLKADTIKDNIKGLEHQKTVKDYQYTQERLYAERKYIDLQNELSDLGQQAADVKADIEYLQEEQQAILNNLSELSEARSMASQDYKRTKRHLYELKPYMSQIEQREIAEKIRQQRDEDERER